MDNVLLESWKLMSKQIADQSFIFEQNEIDEFEVEHWVKDIGLLQKKLTNLKRLTVKSFNDRGFNGGT